MHGFYKLIKSLGRIWHDEAWETEKVNKLLRTETKSRQSWARDKRVIKAEIEIEEYIELRQSRGDN
jgi:hypothetical protein